MNNSTNKIARISVSLLISLTPLIAFAQKKDLNYLISLIASYLNKALLLLMGLAILMFVWYVVKYFIMTGDGDRAAGANYVMWSVIGFFVILSFWGLVNILINTFNLQGTPGSWSDYFNIFPH